MKKINNPSGYWVLLCPLPFTHIHTMVFKGTKQKQLTSFLGFFITLYFLITQLVHAVKYKRQEEVEPKTNQMGCCHLFHGK